MRATLLYLSKANTTAVTELHVHHEVMSFCMLFFIMMKWWEWLKLKEMIVFH